MNTTTTAQLIRRGTVSQSKEDRCRLVGTRKRLGLRRIDPVAENHSSQPLLSNSR